MFLPPRRSPLASYQRAPQKFIVIKGRYAWVRLTILEPYRGSANRNICLSEFLVNLEELGTK